MTAPNRVRIIGGTLRSRVLRFPDRPGLRPTPDRVRETLFNWLGQDLTGKTCLDLFAGSGALGFEAASRGAASVVMVERDRQACEGLRANASLLALHSITVVRADALEFLAAECRRFDVVFLDPPFDAGLLGPVFARIRGVCAPSAALYVESRESMEAGDHWRLHRSGRAGQVHFQVFIHADQ